MESLSVKDKILNSRVFIKCSVQLSKVQDFAPQGNLQFKTKYRINTINIKNRFWELTSILTAYLHCHIKKKMFYLHVHVYFHVQCRYVHIYKNGTLSIPVTVPIQLWDTDPHL